MACIAVAVGVRPEIWTTDVPSLIFDVWPARYASGPNAPEPHASADHTESKPSSSASTVVSMRFGGGS